MPDTHIAHVENVENSYAFSTSECRRLKNSLPLNGLKNGTNRASTSVECGSCKVGASDVVFHALARHPPFAPQKRVRRMIARQAVSALISLAALYGVSAPVRAVPINFEVAGLLATAEAGNPFDLSVGDTITIMAMFDDDLIDDPGTSLVEFGALGNAFGSTLTVTAGSIVLTQADDIGLANIFPTISFTDRSFDFIDFDTGDSPVSLQIFSSGVIEGDGIGGDIDVASASITPKSASVPEPGMLALLGLGLAGLIGRRRRA